MVSVQTWHMLIKDGGRIETFRCHEDEVEEILEDFIQRYGRINHIICEDGDVGKWRFHLVTDDYNGEGSAYYMILSVTEAQYFRLYPHVITLQRRESVERLLDGYEESGYERGIKECKKVLSYFDLEQTTLSSQ